MPDSARRNPFGVATGTLLLATVLASCAVPLESPITGYTCCNLRAEYGWISADNIIGKGYIIPFGQPAQVTSIKREQYTYATIGQDGYGFRDDSAVSAEITLRWVRQLILPEDPKLLFASWPDTIRTAINAGRVLPGMSRRQVAMALGYPSSGETPYLEGAVWRYRTALDDTPVDVLFASDGLVSRVSGSENGVRQVLFTP